MRALCTSWWWWLERHPPLAAHLGAEQSCLSGLRAHSKHRTGDRPAFLLRSGPRIAFLAGVSCALPLGLVLPPGLWNSRTRLWEERPPVLRPWGSLQLWGLFFFFFQSHRGAGATNLGFCWLLTWSALVSTLCPALRIWRIPVSLDLHVVWGGQWDNFYTRDNGATMSCSESRGWSLLTLDSEFFARHNYPQYHGN